MQFSTATLTTTTAQILVEALAAFDAVASPAQPYGEDGYSVSISVGASEIGKLFVDEYYSYVYISDTGALVPTDIDASIELVEAAWRATDLTR